MADKKYGIKRKMFTSICLPKELFERFRAKKGGAKWEDYMEGLYQSVYNQKK